MSWFRRGAKLASSSSHANQARTDATCYCTLNVATAVIDPPRVQVTAAFAVPRASSGSAATHAIVCEEPSRLLLHDRASWRRA